jgi:hypothetical protein
MPILYIIAISHNQTKYTTAISTAIAAITTIAITAVHSSSLNV